VLLSVANANCNGGIADTSQRNEAVSVSAPGTSVLSSVPSEYEYVRAGLSTDKPLPHNKAGSNSANSGASRYSEPRPIQDAGIASTGDYRQMVECDNGAATGATSSRAGAAPPGSSARGTFPTCSAAAGGNVCLFGLPGSRDIYEETCAAMLSCMDGGGGALVAWRGPDVDDLRTSSAAAGRPPTAAVQVGGNQGAGIGPSGPGPRSGGGDEGELGDFDKEILPGARLNCGARCVCWGELQKRVQEGKRILPAVFIGKRQAYDIVDAVRTLKEGAPRANVTVFGFPYRHYDGTSMAAPHVAAGAARVWVDFPNCDASEVARAIKEGAKKMDGTNQVSSGSGMLQIEKAYMKLKSYPCASSAALAGR